ncbi:MAG: PAS domain S-box protein, partial [Candidatus Zixiibacteriota bacterium]
MTKSRIGVGRKRGVGKDNISISSKAGGTSLAGSSVLGSRDERYGLFQLALESLPHPFCLIDANDHSVRLANTASGITKLDGSKKCFAVTHRRRRPCGESGIPCPIDIIKETKTPTVVEHLHRDRFGEQRYYEVHGYPVFDDDGNVASIIEFSLDVTERRLAEEALKKSEDRWRSLVANAPDTIFLVDREARILFVNRCPNARRSEDMVGQSIFECIQARHRQKVLRTIQRVFRTRKPDRYEIESDDKNNGTIWYASRLAPITDGKKVTAVILMTRDVTERKHAEKELIKARAELEKRVEDRTKELKSINEKLSREARVRRTTEQALRDSEELHRVILNQISDTLLITDDQGNFTYVSPRAGDLFGHSREQILAMGSIHRLLGPNLFDREDIRDGKELLNIKRTVVDRAG